MRELIAQIPTPIFGCAILVYGVLVIARHKTGRKRMRLVVGGALSLAGVLYIVGDLIP